MIKARNYHIDDTDKICALGKALSSPERLKIIQLLHSDSMIIGEIAKALHLPPSSAAFHLKILEEAGLLRMEDRPGTRGSTKLCSRKLDFVSIMLYQRAEDTGKIYSIPMPVGMYSDCEIVPTCGLCDANGIIGEPDQEYCFYLPRRVNASLLWSSAGYVEYKFAYKTSAESAVKKVWLSMEVCSEAPAHRQEWKSDITVWINGVDCGTWTSPGDFGDRRGRVTKVSGEAWLPGSTQYGKLVEWVIAEDGCYVNGSRVGDAGVEQLRIQDKPFVTVRIGNKPEAKYVGGFNLFGKDFGDYEQDIVLTLEY